MSSRVLGIQIANGLSSEARVFARLLTHVQGSTVRPLVLFHELSPNNGVATRFEKMSGAPVHPMNFGWQPSNEGQRFGRKITSRLRFLASLPAALEVARRFDPEIIYSSQQIWDCAAATYIARKLRRPQIIHLHYIIGPWLGKSVLMRLRTCSHVITVSNFIREQAITHGVDAQRVTTILNGMDIPAPPEPGSSALFRQGLDVSSSAPLLGIVARLDPYKGQSDTIKALLEIGSKHPDAVLLVVGTDSPWSTGYGLELKALAVKLGLEHKVKFLGQRSDIPSILAAINAFVHPSRDDPCPLAVLEASAAGLPVVAYAEGGVKEIVEDRVTGLLAIPGSIDDLAVQIDLLLSDSSLAERMGVAGRSRVANHFRPQDASAKFAALLADVSGSQW